MVRVAVEDVEDDLSLPTEAAGHPHGTPSNYSAGCRCPDCTRAARLAQRQRRARQRTTSQTRPPAGLPVDDTRDPALGAGAGDEIARLAALVEAHKAAETTRRGAHGWVTDAACAGVDPDLFYPQRGEATEPAKAVCRSCPVQEACLVAALARGEQFGIWGGRSERERRRLRSAIAAHNRRQKALA